MARLPHPFEYSAAYIHQPLPHALFDRIPGSIEVSDRTLVRKTEFHVSLVHLEEMVPHVAASKGVSNAEAQERILSLFAKFAEEYGLGFDSCIDDLRVAEKDERMSVLVRCTVSGLDGFFATCREEFDIGIATQPAHVTLYTLQPDRGIGIPDPHEMDALPRVEVPAVSEALGLV